MVLGNLSLHPPIKILLAVNGFFRIKRHPNGLIVCFKARLAAKGFHQRSGIDYQGTFSPAIKPTTIRVVLCLTLKFGWPIRRLDISNAFLNGHLVEEVYMKQPLGFVDSNHPDFVYRLKKSLYNLK